MLTTQKYRINIAEYVMDIRNDNAILLLLDVLTKESTPSINSFSYIVKKTLDYACLVRYHIIDKFKLSKAHALQRREGSTMAGVIELLKQELAKLQAEITRLQKQAEGVSLTIAYLEEKESIAVSDIAVTTPVSSRTSSKKRSPKKRIRKEKSGGPSPFAQRIIDVLRANGKPMHCRDIVSALESTGTQVNGKEPMRNISAHICLNRQFFSSKEKGYWGLSEWKNADDASIKTVAGALAMEIGDTAA